MTNFRGRSKFAEFWLFGILYLGVGVLILWFSLINAGFLFGIVDAIDKVSPVLSIALFYVLYCLGILASLPFFSLMVRRLHDAGCSGWLFFLFGLTSFGMGVILLLILPGQSASNKYGPSPVAIDKGRLTLGQFGAELRKLNSKKW